MSYERARKKYEEYVYVLDFITRGKSMTVRGREGPIIQSIGESRFTLLEVLGMKNAGFDVGERVCVGKRGRVKVVSVLGKLTYSMLTPRAKMELPSVVEKIVRENEEKFVNYFNRLQPITPRIHSLELIPGIGKTLMFRILNGREEKPFESFEELEKRTGLKDPARAVVKRILQELEGNERINIFVRK